MANLLKFYWRNKGKLFMLIGVITVGIIGIHLLTSIFGSLADTKTQVFQYEAYWTKVILDQDFQEEAELKGDLKSRGDYLVDAKWVSLDYPFFQMAKGSMLLYGVDESDRKFLEEKLDLKIIKGSWYQEGSNQIVVPQYFLYARNKKIGDTIELEYPDASLTLTISGVVEGDYWMALGSKEYFNVLPNRYNYFLAFPNSDNHLEHMNHLQGQYGDKIRIYTPENSKRRVNSLNREYMMIYIGFSLFVSVVIAIALSFLTIIFYRLRTTEFAIKNLVGYSKDDLIRSIRFEQGLILGFSWLVGIFLSFIVLQIVKRSFFAPKGMLLTIDSFSVLGTLIVPLIVFVIVNIYLNRKIRKNNLLQLVLGS